MRQVESMNFGNYSVMGGGRQKFVVPASGGSGLLCAKNTCIASATIVGGAVKRPFGGDGQDSAHELTR